MKLYEDGDIVQVVDNVSARKWFKPLDPAAKEVTAYLQGGTTAVVNKDQVHNSTEVRCTIDGHGIESWLLQSSQLEVRANFLPGTPY